MKIKTKRASYAQVMALPRQMHIAPHRPSWLFRTLLKLVSLPDLWATKFRCRRIGMEKLGKREPCLILMNHSSFIDLEIASSILYPRPFNIVCTSDGFVGKKWLMRQLGCIPTQKFVSDLRLVRDMVTATRKNGCAVLMYPEASYSFDGTATPLPDTLGSCIKLLGVPLIMIRTQGAFARDPLYNNLQRRRVKVSAEMEYLLSPEQIKAMRPAEINALLKEQFSFDYFRWQEEMGLEICAPFRADCLNRVLYQCPHCEKEGQMEGKGIHLTCHACGKRWELTTLGKMRAIEGETEFAHIPDWYAWERANVRRALEEGSYSLDVPVKIGMMVNMKAIYMVGEGRLTHTADGFTLRGCDGQLEYTQKPLSSYSLYADYYWYELGDMIAIGTNEVMYYCFPQTEGDVVAKTRLAAEELYRIQSEQKKANRVEK